MADNVMKAKIVADTSGFTGNVEKATGSIEELKQVSKSLKAEIGGLDAQLRNSKGGKALSNELKVVTAELKTLERQAGISGQATGNALQKGFSGVRTLANILPGIGIAGIFGLAFEGLEKLISSLGRLGGALDPVKELANTMHAAEKSFVKAYTEVGTLREQIDLAKRGFIEKDSVVKLYNETIGKTTGVVKTLDEAEAALNKNAEAYIRFTLLKAAANIALGKAAEKAFEAEEKRLKAIQEFNTIGSRASTFSSGQSSAPGFVPGQNINAGLEARQEAARKAKEAAIKDAKDQEKVFTDIADGLLKQAGDLSKAFGFDFNAGNKIEKAKTLESIVSETVSKAKELASFLNARSVRDIKFDVDPRDSLGETLKKARAFIAATKDINKNFNLKLNSLPPAFADIKFLARPNVVIDDDNFKGLAGQTQDLQEKLQKEIDRLTARNPILIRFNAKVAADKKMEELIAKQAADLADSIKGSVGNAIEGFGAAIGDAISGKDFGAAIVNVIGDLIQQIGRALVKFAIVKGILDKILANPLTIGAGTALALGIAAIAIGQLVKNIKPQGARASGGGVNAGQGYYVGEKGTEMFVPNTAGRIIPNSALAGTTGRAQPQAVNVQGKFVISGNDLIAVLSSASRSQNRLS